MPFLYVGNLGLDYDQDAIEKDFTHFGTVSPSNFILFSKLILFLPNPLLKCPSNFNLFFKCYGLMVKV